MGRLSETKECQGFRSPHNNFLSGLERASEIVKTWPNWKQNVLGSSIPISTMSSKNKSQGQMDLFASSEPPKNKTNETRGTSTSVSNKDHAKERKKKKNRKPKCEECMHKYYCETESEIENSESSLCDSFRSEYMTLDYMYHYLFHDKSIFNLTSKNKNNLDAFISDHILHTAQTKHELDIALIRARRTLNKGSYIER